MADGSHALDIEVAGFGCRLNIAESEGMRRAALAAGLTNAVLVNSCAVTAEAVRQARQAVRRARRERPEARIVLSGCAAEIDGAAFAGMAEVDLVLGNAEKLDPAAYRTNERVKIGAVHHGHARALAAGQIEGHTRGFVEVQNGCDHRCTFCVIPFGRGPSRSVAIADVVARVTRFVAAGIKEVVLTGVDTTSYGADLPGAPKLGQLVRTVLRAVPGLPRLRLGSVDVAEVDEALVAAFAEEPRLMPHLHLSLQSGDNLILKRMKRRHGREDAIAFCARLRRERPDMVFGADLIAGFPTETDEAFARSLDLVSECELSKLHVFPYSARPGTPSARMPPVPETVVKERAARLRALGGATFAARLAREASRPQRVLVEAGGQGHTEGFLPVWFLNAPRRGEIVTARILGHDGKRLEAA